MSLSNLLQMNKNLFFLILFASLFIISSCINERSTGVTISTNKKQFYYDLFGSELNVTITNNEDNSIYYMHLNENCYNNPEIYIMKDNGWENYGRDYCYGKPTVNVLASNESIGLGDLFFANILPGHPHGKYKLEFIYSKDKELRENFSVETNFEIIKDPPITDNGEKIITKLYPEEYYMACRSLDPYYVKGNKVIKSEIRNNKSQDIEQEECKVEKVAYANYSGEIFTNIMVYCNGQVTYFHLVEIPSLWINEKEQLIGCEYPA